MACASRADRAHLLGGQGLDLVGRATVPRRSRRRAGNWERAAIRPASDPQPAVLAGASADPVRDESGRTASAMSASRRRKGAAIATSNSIMREAADRFRAGDVQCAGPRGGGAHPAARARSRHRGDREPAVPRGRADPAVARTSAPRLGRGDRLQRAGRNSCSSSSSRTRPSHAPYRRNRQCRPCAGEHERRARHAARRGDARADGGRRRGA